MQVIQIILVTAVVALCAIVLVTRSGYAINAWKKLSLILLMVLMFVAIINPDFVTDIAHVVGIGRGADLVLYILFFAFLFYVLGQYIKAQKQRSQLHTLARKLALLEARIEVANKHQSK